MPVLVPPAHGMLKGIRYRSCRCYVPEATLAWIKFLNPKELKKNLIKASVYIVFFEQLKSTIVDKVKSFYWIGL